MIGSSVAHNLRKKFHNGNEYIQQMHGINSMITQKGKEQKSDRQQRKKWMTGPQKSDRMLREKKRKE